MNMFKKLIALSAALAMLGSGTVCADEYYVAGDAYEESRGAPALAPAIALGAIAIVAIIAVAVQNSNNKHGHCHQH